MKVIWTDLAKWQLKEIYLYYKEVASLKVAHAIEQKIFIKTRKLARNHQLGQEEINPAVAGLKYRYLVSGSYKIIYRVLEKEKTVLIVSVFDTRRDPGSLKLN